MASPRALTTLPVLFGVASLSWAVGSAIAPQAASAYTARRAIVVVRQENESYQTLLRRAETIARAAAQRSFDSDILVTQVAITVHGQNNGAVVSVLKLEVSRQDWRKEPDTRRWAQYFPNAALLLRFEPTPLPPTVIPPPAPAESDEPGELELFEVPSPEEFVPEFPPLPPT